MRLQSPFATIAPTLDGDVLAVLAGAEEWFTVPHVRSLIGARSVEGIRKALGRLAAEGVVDTMSGGRATLYRLNRDHLAAPAILELADLRVTFIRRLRDDMAAWTTPPAYAAIFGSGARNDMRSDSDVDLFILRPDEAADDWDARVQNLVIRASRWTGNDVRPVEFTVSEARGAGSSEPVLLDVVDEGITVFGDRLRFRQLVRTR